MKTWLAQIFRAAAVLFLLAGCAAPTARPTIPVITEKAPPSLAQAPVTTPTIAIPLPTATSSLASPPTAFPTHDSIGSSFPTPTFLPLPTVTMNPQTAANMPSLAVVDSSTTICSSPTVDDFTAPGVIHDEIQSFGEGRAVDGTYKVKMIEAKSGLLIADGTPSGDNILAVDTDSTASGKISYGLVFGRDSKDNSYAFMITDDGSWAVFKHEANSNNWTAIRDFRTGSFIVPKGKNHIGVVRVGKLISPYINGYPAGSSFWLDDLEGDLSGGLLIWSQEQANVSVEFDNYIQCKLTNPWPMWLRPIGEYTLLWPEEAPIRLNYTWMSTSEQFANDFTENSKVQFSIDGVEYDPAILKSFWRPPDYKNQAYAVSWQAVLSKLPPGTHRLAFKISLTKQITDGYDTDNDGKLDYYGPGLLQDGWIEVNIQ